jgi:hypothetical protein
LRNNLQQLSILAKFTGTCIASDVNISFDYNYRIANADQQDFDVVIGLFNNTITLLCFS